MFGSGRIDRARSTEVQRRSQVDDEVRRPGLLLAFRLRQQRAAARPLPRPGASRWRRRWPARAVPGDHRRTVRAGSSAHVPPGPDVGQRRPSSSGGQQQLDALPPFDRKSSYAARRSDDRDSCELLTNGPDPDRSG